MMELYGLRRDFTRSGNTLAGLIAKATRPRVAFTNMQMCFADYEEEGMIYRPELEVLVDTMLVYLDENSQALGAPDYGSLAVYGQQFSSLGSLTLCLLVADLKGGPCRISQEDPVLDRTSREDVCSAARIALKHGAGIDKAEVPAFLRDAKADGVGLRSGIYFDKEHYGVRGADNRMVLVLNGDRGRFAASACCSGLMGDFELLVLIARTLAGLRPGDQRLQESVRIVQGQIADDSLRCSKIMEAVKQMFLDGTDPLLKAWQDWSSQA